MTTPASPIPAGLRWLFAVAACIFVVRDSLAIVIRWMLNGAGLDFLWFSVDVFAFLAFPVFIYYFCFKEKSPAAVLVVALFITSIFVGFATVGFYPAWMLMSVKMYIPLFLGWIFAGSDIAEYRFVRWIMVSMVIAAVVGVILDQVMEVPWSDFTIEQFGKEKVLYLNRWLSGEWRVPGFSGDPDTTSKTVSIAFLLIYRHLRPAAALILLAGLVYLTSLTQIRTVYAIVLITMLFVVLHSYVFAGLRTVRAHRIFALSSYLLILMPIIMMVVLGSIDLTEISRDLFSLQERVNSSWISPFTYLWDKAPVSLFMGCGFGCALPTIETTPWHHFPSVIDNYYIVSYLMFGPPFILVIAAMIAGTAYENDRGKLLQTVMFNVGALMSLHFNPSTAMFAIGYATSQMHFLRFSRPAQATRKTMPSWG